MPAKPARSSQATKAAPPLSFGRRIEDLDIDFDDRDRLDLAVAIVASREDEGSSLEQRRDRAWRLPIGRRILRLLEIVARSQDDPNLYLAISCPQESCGEKLELPLPLAGLIEHGKEALDQGDQLDWQMGPSSPSLALRRPTGRDQAAWRTQRFASPQDATRALLQSLAVGKGKRIPCLNTRQEAKLSEALSDFDPLAAFRLSARCPACQGESQVPIDLERLCLDRLRALQSDLITAIHRLAIRYGWTEGDVIALSPARRAHYLALIDKDESPA